MKIFMKENGTYFVRYRLNGVQRQKTFGKGEKAKIAAEIFQASMCYVKQQELTPENQE